MGEVMGDLATLGLSNLYYQVNLLENKISLSADFARTLGAAHSKDDLGA